MQTAGGGLQVIRSVEFQERGELENTCTLHTWSHPRCCCHSLLLLLFDCVWEKRGGMKSRAPLVGREDEFIF